MTASDLLLASASFTAGVLAAIFYATPSLTHSAPVSLGGGKAADIEIFKAEWCGHCKRFEPELRELQKRARAAGKTVAVYDADDPASAPVMKARGVEGFPTVLVHGAVYSGPRTAADILASA